MPVVFLVCGLMVITAATPMAAESGGLTGDQKKALDRFIGQFVDLAMFDGTVLIDIGGKIVYSRSFGLAHYELGVPHSENTRFRIASVSKSLTDTAFAKMIEQKKLTLDTPLARYLPDFPSAERITLGQLLSHTSGIPHTNAQPWGDGSISLTISEIVDRLAQLPLDFEPGTESKYSNGGYAVATRVLEIAGKAGFSEVMDSTVFGPLGMKDTGHIADARVPIEGMATGYEPGRYPGERRHPRFYAVESRPGGGSLYSSAQDLLHFIRAVFREDFVSADLRRDVLGADEDGFLSQGRSPGFVAKLYYAAEDDLIVVSVANSYAVPADWAKKIAAIATGSSDVADWPEIHPTKPTIAADDSRLGRYRSSRGGTETTIERTERGAMEISGSHGQGSTALIPLSDGAFLMPLYFQRCEQAEETRVITCAILSGDTRYSTTLTPVLQGDAVSE
jgi:CubicO group peptidase (beta-lactamase class C family)